MVAGCSATCIKYLFFTFNFLIFVCGSGILGVSLWARFDNNFRQYIVDLLDKAGQSQDVPEIQRLYWALYLIAAIGALLLICGFLGCCGACCENTCLLGMFFIIIFVLFLAEIAAGIYIFIKKDKVRDDLKKILTELYANESPDVKRGLDQMEEQLKCCGADGCSLTGLSLDCCVKRPGATSCTDALFENMKKNFTIVAIVALCVLAIELLAMMFACCLWSSIRQTAYSYY